MDNSGSYVVTWSSKNQDGGTWGVYARRFDSNGNAEAGEILVNQTTSNEQRWSRVATDASGNFCGYVDQQSSSGGTQGVYARRFSAAGTAGIVERISSQYDDIRRPAGFRGLNESYRSVYRCMAGQRFGGLGRDFLPSVRIKWYCTGCDRASGERDRRGTERDPAVAIDASGNSVVVWEVK